MTDSYETVNVERDGRVATVALDRPEVLNAVNMQMYEDLPRVFADLSDDESIWVVVLTGHGRAFSVGADLKERPSMSTADIRRRRRLAPEMFGSIATCLKPVLAAVHGYALGGGLELAIACDIVLAAEGTTFGLPETALGVIPGGGATQRLPRLVGPQLAKELIFTGRRFSAEDARSMGLVAHVRPSDALLADTQSLAHEIAANAPVAVYQAKKAINAAQSLDVEHGLRFEEEAYQSCLATLDREEGLAAARERRKPRFVGR